VSTVPLELFGDKFRLVGTLGKLANIVAEVGEIDKVAEGLLKAFVTGDPLEFERKFKPAFTARPTARLILATNNPPRFSDKSDGVWRRMIPLPFTVQIPPSEQRPGMDKPAFWIASGELPGIFNWAFAGLHALRKARRFTVPPSCCAAGEKMRTESNPARLFLQEHYQAGSGVIATADLYEGYVEWCRKNGHHPLAEVGFGKEVYRLFKSVKEGKEPKGASGKRRRTYVGLVRVEGADEPDEGSIWDVQAPF
jgi:P4 family phage/plasmid primase-like protien